MMRLRVLVLMMLLVSGWVNAAELPRVLIDTTYRKTTPGSTTSVPSGGNLQIAINNAVCGDTLELEAGATFTGEFTLPDKDCTDDTWVYIRTATPDGTFPRPGNRVGPEHASLMAKLTDTGGADSERVILTASDADHYRFVGIEIAASEYKTAVIYMENGAGTANQASHVTFDRCYIHGHSTLGSRRGINANGAYIAVIDSYLSDFKEVGQDSQAFAAWNGSGPFKLVNNYIGGAAENVLFGGADSASVDYIPADIEIRRNRIAKPLSWWPSHGSYEGTNWQVKNLVEFKVGFRSLVEGNLLEQNWSAAQSGMAFNVKSTNQDGTAAWSLTKNLTIRGNLVRHVGQANAVGGFDGSGSTNPTEAIVLQHNLVYDAGTTWDVASDGRANYFYHTLTSSTFNHNTHIHTGDTLITDGDASPGLNYNYNIQQKGTYGIKGAGQSSGNATIAAYFTSSSFSTNVLQGVTCVDYPATTECPATLGDIGFENLGADDYRLNSASDYYGVGDAGSDLGAWVPAATAAASQLDWDVKVQNGYTAVAVTFGVPGLPYNQSCSVRVGSAITTSATGPSRRTVVVTGLTPTSSYFVGVDCGTTWGGWLSWENFTAASVPGGTKTVGFSLRPPATLTTVERAKVECSTSSDMSNPVSAQDTTCTSAAVCDVQVASVPSGINYCRHTYQTSGDATVVVGAVQVVSVS